jgi:hypothetical protein
MFFGQTPFPKEFMEMMEKMFVEKINDAIRDPAFLNQFGKVVGAGLDGKKKMDDASRAYLERMNMPTRDDIARILQYLQQIENRLIAVEEKVEDLSPPAIVPRPPKAASRQTTSSATAAKKPLRVKKGKNT